MLCFPRSADSLSVSPHWTALLDHCATSGAFLSVPDPACNLMGLPPPEAWDPTQEAEEDTWNWDAKQTTTTTGAGASGFGAGFDWGAYGMGDMIAGEGDAAAAAAAADAGGGGGGSGAAAAAADEPEEGELEDGEEEVGEYGGAAEQQRHRAAFSAATEVIEVEVDIGLPDEDGFRGDGAFDC